MSPKTGYNLEPRIVEPILDEPDKDFNPDFDEANPRSLINILPSVLQDRLIRIPKDMLAMSEEEILLEAFGKERTPDATANRLRLSFWHEYDRCQRVNDPVMDASRICHRICTRPYFFKKFLHKDILFVFLLHPPGDYTAELHEIHELALRSLRKACTLNILNSKDQPNTKLIDMQLRIFEHVDMRLKGAIIQRIDQRNLNVNVNAEATQDLSTEVNRIGRMTMEEIDSQLKHLEAKSKRLSAPSHVAVDLMPDKLEADEKPQDTKGNPVS